MPYKHYTIIDPSTIAELDARIYNSLANNEHTFTITGERILDQLAIQRGEHETREFTCRVSDLHPLPRSEYYVIATIPTSQEAIRIEVVQSKLEATVFLND